MKLELIQDETLNSFIGDTCPILIVFNENIFSKIKKCFIVSSGLQLNEEMQRRDTEYAFEYVINSTKTAELKPQTYTFDIQLEFENGNILSQSPLNLTMNCRQNPSNSKEV